MDNLEEFEDLEDSSEIIIVKDESGNDIEFSIVDGIEYKNNRYLLVIESEFLDEDEIEAVILKEVNEKNGESVYCILEEEEEFNKIAELFKNSNEEYDIEV